MRIAFAGTPDVALPSLRALIAAGHDIVAVITRPDAPAGRGRVMTPSPVAQFAEASGLRVLKPKLLPEIADELRELSPECIGVVAFGALIPPDMLDIPHYGWINLHFSVLPAWRGAAPVQRAIMAGDDVTGASTFRIDAGLDTGPVFGTLTRAITSDDTAGSLLQALAEDGAALLAQTIGRVASLQPVGQSADGVSHAAKLTKAEARIDWSHPALVIDRRIRGCTPEPGGWAVISGEQIAIGPIQLRSDVTDLEPGRIRVAKQVLVGTGSHAIELLQVKPAGKRWMHASEWVRGLRDVPESFDVD